MEYPNMFEILRKNIPPYLCQGDLFLRFGGNILPPVSPKEVGFMVLNYDCDLINQKELNYICICPIFNIEVLLKIYVQESLKINPEKSKKNITNQIVKNMDNLFNNKKKYYFFLSPINEFNDTPSFADLLRIYTLPINYLNDIFKSRVKVLKHPWREKLGWKVSYIFHRVALPDIDEEKAQKYVINHDIVKRLLPE